MDVHLVGGTLTARRVLPDADRVPLPARVRIAEAAVAGDPARFQASHAAILLHDAADIAQRAPWVFVGPCHYYCSHDACGLPTVVLGYSTARLLIIHKPLGYFRKIGFVLPVYNHELHI